MGKPTVALRRTPMRHVISGLSSSWRAEKRASNVTGGGNMAPSLATCVAWMWTVATMTAVRGFSTFPYEVPNGRRVNCTEEMEGCSVGEPCLGLGHNTCAGGSLPLNPFGADFADALYSWTEELCQMDSDNDGLTNGEELGDPCCEWTTMSMDMLDDEFIPSHPGYAFSVPPKNVTCDNGQE
eukprot:scaffold412_cov311-Pavlova_lutheri.AAC.3